jgi:hypothetical protein
MPMAAIVHGYSPKGSAESLLSKEAPPEINQAQ